MSAMRRRSLTFDTRRRDAFAALERAVERVEGLLDEDEAAAQAPRPLSLMSQPTLLAKNVL